jgi:hypothetical protein
MTVAVCLECGTMKPGAWAPCPACGYQPAGAEELAKSLMASDSCIAREKLEEMAARRRQGEPWNFDPQLVEMFKERVAALIPLTPGGLPAPEAGGAASRPPEQQGLPPRAEGEHKREPRKAWWQFWK